MEAESGSGMEGLAAVGESSGMGSDGAGEAGIFVDDLSGMQIVA